MKKRKRRLQKIVDGLMEEMGRLRIKHEHELYVIRCERDETVATYKDALQEEIAKRNKLEKIYPRTGIKSLEQTRDDLADVVWFIKGMRMMADAKNETCDFSGGHIEAIRFVMERLKAEIKDQLDEKPPVAIDTKGGMLLKNISANDTRTAFASSTTQNQPITVRSMAAECGLLAATSAAGS